MIRTPRWLFWASAVVGWAVIGLGLRGLFHHHVDTRPANLARFVVGGALAHDVLLAPLVLGVGVVVARAVPASIRAVVQGALIVTGVVLLFAWPLVRGYGHILRNPSSLPRNYAASVAIVVGAVWVVAAGLAVLAWRRAQRERAAVSTISVPKSTG